MISNRPNLRWFGAIEVSLKPEVSRVYLDDPGCDMMIVYDWLWRRESQQPEENRIHIPCAGISGLTQIPRHLIHKLAGFLEHVDFRLLGRRALSGQVDLFKYCHRDSEVYEQANHQ